MSLFPRVEYPCPLNYNPADHYVHVLAVTPGNERVCKERVNKICDAFDVSPDGTKLHQCQFKLKTLAFILL